MDYSKYFACIIRFDPQKIPRHNYQPQRRQPRLRNISDLSELTANTVDPKFEAEQPLIGL